MLRTELPLEVGYLALEGETDLIIGGAMEQAMEREDQRDAEQHKGYDDAEAKSRARPSEGREVVEPSERESQSRRRRSEGEGNHR